MAASLRLPGYLGWTLAAMLLSTLPFTFHRMVSPTVAGMVFYASIAGVWRPIRDDCSAHGCRLASRPLRTRSLSLLLRAPRLSVWKQRAGVHHILVCSNADVGLVSEVTRRKDPAEREPFGAVCVVAAGFALLETIGRAAPALLLPGPSFAWLCLAAAIALSGWALFAALKDRGWQCRPRNAAHLAKPRYRPAVAACQSGSRPGAGHLRRRAVSDSQPHPRYAQSRRFDRGQRKIQSPLRNDRRLLRRYSARCVRVQRHGWGCVCKELHETARSEGGRLGA